MQIVRNALDMEHMKMFVTRVQSTKNQSTVKKTVRIMTITLKKVLKIVSRVTKNVEDASDQDHHYVIVAEILEFI